MIKIPKPPKPRIIKEWEEPPKPPLGKPRKIKEHNAPPLGLKPKSIDILKRIK